MNFIDYYIKTMSALTDAPEKYHRAAAYFVLSAVINGRMAVPLSYEKIYPNIWLLILGPSGDRKTTSMTKAETLLFHTQQMRELSVPNDFTPAALIDKLSSRNPSRGYFIKDEFAGMMADMKKEYMEGLSELFMKMYDCPAYWTTARKTSGDFTMFDVYLCMLTGTTYKRLERYIKLDDVLSGFVPRFYIICSEGRKGFKPVRMHSEDDAYRFEALQHAIAELDRSLRFGDVTVTLSDEALEYYNEWLQKREVLAKTEIERVFHFRAQTYVIKFATIYEVADDMHTKIESIKNIRRLDISLDTLKEAIAMVEDDYSDSIPVIDELISNAFYKNKQNILKRVKEAGEKGIYHSELLRFSHMSAWEFNNILATLLEEELVEKIGKSKKKYRVLI